MLFKSLVLEVVAELVFAFFIHVADADVVLILVVDHSDRTSSRGARGVVSQIFDKGFLSSV